MRANYQEKLARAGRIDAEPNRRLGQLAEHLAKPSNLNQITEQAVNGGLWTRDSAFMTTSERNAVVAAGRELFLNNGLFERIITNSTDRFAKLMRGETQDGLQDNAGWNFLVNAQSFAEQGYAWALNFDWTLANHINLPGESGINTLLYNSQMYGIEPFEPQLREIIADFSTTDQNRTAMAWYLAERSLTSEEYQRSQYSQELEIAKENVSGFINYLAGTVGLSREATERTFRQVELTDFSGFDHLLYGVTNYDQGSLGDYMWGTLRVEVKLAGSPACNAVIDSPDGTIHHELLHAASAQTPDGQIGLKFQDSGNEVNEAMTEYLSRLAQRQVYVDETGAVNFVEAPSYGAEVAALVTLESVELSLFQCLVKSYFGDTVKKSEIKKALELYYEILG